MEKEKQTPKAPGTTPAPVRAVNAPASPKIVIVREWRDASKGKDGKVPIDEKTGKPKQYAAFYAKVNFKGHPARFELVPAGEYGGVDDKGNRIINNADYTRCGLALRVKSLALTSSARIFLTFRLSMP